MTRKEREKALAANEHSPIRTLAALTALSDKELEGLEAHVTKKADEVKAAADKKKADDEAALKAAADKKKADDEAAARAASGQNPPQPPTEEEWLKTAPPSIRTLVADAKATEAAQKERLLTALKGAQKEYTEEELKAMDSKQLARIARLANVEATPGAVDYSGRGFPRVNNDQDVYRNPPSGYRAALDARKEAEKKGVVN